MLSIADWRRNIGDARIPYDDFRDDFQNDDYTVGWVCALPKERTAATAMLDRRHADLPKPPNDPNTYILGSVGKHNVAIAYLPRGKIGNNSAATVAAWMISTFPSTKFGLMDGIGGGVPPKVRLGDVVVSTPVVQFPGVVQWDIGKAKEGGSFERTRSLNNPPSALLAALTKLETDHELTSSRILERKPAEDREENFRGTACGSLRKLIFKPEYSRDINKKNIKRLKRIFERQGCLCDGSRESARYMPYIVE